MTQQVVTLDFETRSECDLKEAGAVVYSQHPTTEVLCLGYQIDDEPRRLWAPTGRMATDERMPADLIRAVETGAIMDAHSTLFERSIWAAIMVGRYNWMPVKDEQWDDSMAACAYRALPLKLEKAAQILNLRNQKDMDGNRLTKQMSKPRKPTKKNPSKWIEDFASLQRAYDYCDGDIAAEKELRGRVGWLPPAERKVWLLDQEINLRGVQIDLEVVDAAQAMVDRVEAALTAELVELTGGEVETTDQIARFVAWAERNGTRLPNLQAETVEMWLNPANRDISEPVRRGLEIRQALGKASAKKLRSMRACAGNDGRIRGTLQYHGASTGRWAGRLIQPQNFPRPQWENLDPEVLIADIMRGDSEYMDLIYGNTLDAVAQALRHMIVAAPGSRLIAGDFSAIEAVVNACLAGETWKIQLFRDGGDPYLAFASTVFGRPITKADKKERQVGKIGELAFGYQGGVGAWRNFDSSDAHDDEAVDAYKVAWRDKHPMIVALWRGLEAACTSAVSKGEGGVAEYRGIEYRHEGEWLSCRLLSGRKLWYYAPRIEFEAVPWDETDYRPKVIYKAWRLGQWRDVGLYGGLLCENVVQATARDLLVNAMFAIREFQSVYPIVMTVHDEIVTESDYTGASRVTLAKIMAESNRPKWAADWPIKVEAWDGVRYRK